MGQCPSLETIGALLEDKVSADEKKKLLAHISMCPHCSNLYVSGGLHMALDAEGLIPKISQQMQQRMTTNLQALMQKRLICMHLQWSHETITFFNAHKHLQVAEDPHTFDLLFNTQTIENFNYPCCYFLYHQNGFNIYATDDMPCVLKINHQTRIDLSFKSGLFQLTKPMLGLKENETLELLSATGETSRDIKLVFEVKK